MARSTLGLETNETQRLRKGGTRTLTLVLPRFGGVRLRAQAIVLGAVALATAQVAHAGTNLWTSHGPEGGSISVFAMDPSTPSTLYAGAGGTGVGVFKSTDSGASWTPANNGLGAGNSVSALAIDLSTPSTLYVATGVGVFKSSDGAGSWVAVNTSEDFKFVTALVIDPRNTDTLYAGTEFGGVFKSTNGGGTWTAAVTAVSFFLRGVTTLVIDPTTTSTIYGSIAGDAATNGGVIKSTDSGANWSLVPAPANATVLTIAPTSPSTIYAGAPAPYDVAVFKSTDGGANWSDSGWPANTGRLYALVIAPSATRVLYALTDGGVVASGDYGGSWACVISLPHSLVGMTTLAVEPGTPTTLYAGGAPGFPENNSVLKSTDGGASWSPAKTGLTATQVNALVIDPNTPRTLYAGVEGVGVFKTTDGGTTWSWNVPGNLLAGNSLTTIAALAIDRVTPSTLYAGTVTGVMKSTDSGANWNPANTGIGSPHFADQVFALAVDPVTPSTLYAATFHGVLKSTDSAAHWSPANKGLPASVQAFVIDPSTPSTLYAATRDGVFTSTDSGANWSAANTGLTSPVFALAIDPSTSTLYAASGGVFKSTDSGASWSPAGLPGASVQSFAIDPSNPSTLYAGTQLFGVFKTTDGGVHWSHFNSSAVNTGFPVSWVTALAIDPHTPSTLYAGTVGGGVYDIEQVAIAPTPAQGVCTGDCDGDGQVTVNELITMVNIALGNSPVSACAAGDANGDGQITINKIIAAVNSALNGCAATPTPNQTPSPTTPTPVASQIPTPTPTSQSGGSTPTSSPGSGNPHAIQAAGIYVFDTAIGVAAPQILQYTTSLATGATSLATMAPAGTGLQTLSFTADGKHAYGLDSTGNIWGYSVSSTGVLTPAGSGPTAPPTGTAAPTSLLLYDSSVLWALTQSFGAAGTPTTVQQYPINSDGTLGSPTAVSLTGYVYGPFRPGGSDVYTAIWTASAPDTTNSLVTLNVYPVNSNGMISATSIQTLTTPSSLARGALNTFAVGVGGAHGGAQTLYTYSLATDGTLTANPTVSLPATTRFWQPATSSLTIPEIGGTLDLIDGTAEENLLVYQISSSGVVGTELQAMPLGGFPAFPFSVNLTVPPPPFTRALPTLWVHPSGTTTINEFTINSDGTIGAASGSVPFGGTASLGGYVNNPFIYSIDISGTVPEISTVYVDQVDSTGALTAQGSFVPTVPSPSVVTLSYSFEPDFASGSPVALFVYALDLTNGTGTILVYPLGSNGMPSSATPLDSISLPGESHESYVVFESGKVTPYLF